MNRHSDKVIHGSLVDTGAPKKNCILLFMQNGQTLLFVFGISVAIEFIHVLPFTPKCFSQYFPKEEFGGQSKDANPGQEAFLSAASLLCDLVQMMSLFLISYSHL